MNGGGRSVQQNVIRQNEIGGLSIAGGRTNNTVFLVDGAANTDPDYNSLNYSPSVDSINEFQVQAAMVGAEYSRASINLVTKSGTNEFHGGAWEFLRNNDFDARPFNLAQSNVPAYRRNQFGGNVGGPILKSKLFGFFTYEGLKVGQAAANLTSVQVPTAEQRLGDFSLVDPKGIKDPDNIVNGKAQLFTGGKIPTARINPLALAAINAMPLPSTPGSSLFQNTTELLTQDNNNYSGRVTTRSRRTGPCSRAIRLPGKTPAFRPPSLTVRA